MVLIFSDLVKINDDEEYSGDKYRNKNILKPEIMRLESKKRETGVFTFVFRRGSAKDELSNISISQVT